MDVKVKATTTRCVHCDDEIALGDEALAHYANSHADKAVHRVYISLSEMVRLAPDLTIKPLDQGINLVVYSCGCGANVCHNTSGCPVSA